MKSLIIALIVSASAVPAFAGQFQTVPEYQNDFSRAKPCKQMLGGKLVWKGERAFYIQANQFYTDETGQVADDFANAIDRSNDYVALTPFRKACR